MSHIEVSSGTIWHKRGAWCPPRFAVDFVQEPPIASTGHARWRDLGCKFLTPKCVRSAQESSGFILRSLGSEEIPHRHRLCFNGGNRSGFVMCIETRSVPARACVAILLNHNLPPDNRAGGFWSGVRGTCSHN